MASIDEIKEIYSKYDQDKNGVLTIDEAELAFKALGANARNVDFEKHFKQLAKAGGTITFDEFKTFAKMC